MSIPSPRARCHLGAVLAALLAVAAVPAARAAAAAPTVPSRADEPVAAPDADLAARLQGAWRDVEQETHVLVFDGAHSVTAWRFQQTAYAVVYEADRVVRTPLGGFGDTLTSEVSFADGALTLSWPGGRTSTFRRLDEVPIEGASHAVPLGDRTPDTDELVALREEFAERVAHEQDLRERMQARMEQAMASGEVSDAASQAAFLNGEEMQAITTAMRDADTENTGRLLALLADVGWLDGARFGRQLQGDAFLIVQHSGHLGLMRTVLPLLEGEARSDPAVGQSFALLWDRTWLALGGEQRYGSQLTTREDGALVVERLEDPAGVDERRASVGMGPLERYLDLFRARGQVVVSPLDP